MLDFVYYPVSAVLWLWHTAFAAVFGGASGLAWVLAVIFLVMTLRALLLRPFLAQARFMRALAAAQPEMQRIQRDYADDPTRRTAELRKIQQQHGVNVLTGFLPIVAQGLVFLGLFHVLRSFQDAATANYVFGADQVRSFLSATVFGAPLTSALTTVADTFAATTAVVIPLALLTAVVTHLTARVSLRRQEPTTGQFADIMKFVSLWVFPIGSVIAGAVMPLAIVVYFATNSVWTLVQQHVVARRTGAQPDVVPG
ncbi:membrane protein insertase YidC [Nocardia uniformis]|uniref:Membrane protein insertase YidC n=1 Tax=Nocardia uniformis TaxID=53432 RepID=A0A849CK30_9NOCA|nr:membrane protein insertase YidC [Nocardia uniformis]NNH75221.1 membrane protein insertase YidC [Nocardia uniformis]